MAKASGSIDLKSLKVAGEPNKYITKIDNNGITVHAANNINYIQINSDGLEIFKSDGASTPSAISIAKFGSTVRIGAETNGNVQITPLGIDIYNGQLDNVFHAGLSTNTMSYERYLAGPLKVAPNTTVSITIPTLANGTTVYYEVASGTTIYRDVFTFGEAVSGGSFEYDGGTRITYTNGSGTDPDFLTIYLDVTDEVAPAWTFGARVGDVGGFSTIVGLNCEASQNYAYAIGQTAKATGFLSFAQGSYVTAAGTWQHVIGKWNKIDTADKYAFIIGNGSAAGGRKDALTVDWSGNVAASSFTGALYGNATTSNVSVRATYARYYSSDTIGITAYSSNEINFVGESTADRVYIGYRTLESPQISNYYFCDSSSNTSGRGNVYCGALNATGITIGGTSLIYIIATGSSGNWTYRKWSDGTIDAWYSGSMSLTHYTTVNGFYGYATSDYISLPFTMANADYTAIAEWKIGSGFSMSGTINRTTTGVKPFALGTAQGPSTCYIMMYIHGTLA